jgi:drug/metabolite transporter (DMT)-like permease
MVEPAAGDTRGRRDMRDIIRHRGGVVPLIAASVVFALWNAAYKYAVDGLPVMTVLSVMLLTAAAALWGCALVKGRQRLTRGQLRRVAVMGMIDPAIGYVLIGVGLTHVEATVSAMLDGTEACFVVAFCAIIARRSPGPRAVIGVLLSAAGVAVLGGTHSLLGIGPWNLVVLAGVACAGLCNVLTDRVLGDDVAVCAGTSGSWPRVCGAEASWKCPQVSQTVNRWSQPGNNIGYVLDLTAVNMEWWRPDGAGLTGPQHNGDRTGGAD